jgi:hypothetical protein
VAAALLLGAAKVGAPLIGKLISGGARPLQNVDKAAIDALFRAGDGVGLYHVMYDHQSGNPDPAVMWWRSKAREYASRKFQELQQSGVTIDQSRLYVRELERISDAEGAVESGAARVVSQRPGPDYRAAIDLPPASTVEGIVAAVEAAAARGDAAAQAELNTRLALGAGGEAARQTALEQQASILPLGALTGKTLLLVVVLVIAFALFTRVGK